MRKVDNKIRKYSMRMGRGLVQCVCTTFYTGRAYEINIKIIIYDLPARHMSIF